MFKVAYVGIREDKDKWIGSRVGVNGGSKMFEAVDILLLEISPYVVPAMGFMTLSCKSI